MSSDIGPGLEHNVDVSAHSFAFLLDRSIDSGESPRPSTSVMHKVTHHHTYVRFSSHHSPRTFLSDGSRQLVANRNYGTRRHEMPTQISFQNGKSKAAGFNPRPCVRGDSFRPRRNRGNCCFNPRPCVRGDSESEE